MADEQQAAERTEDATPKRLEDARKKGDVARSRELDTATMLGVGLAGLLFLGPAAVDRLRALARRLWTLERDVLFDVGALQAHLLTSVIDALLAIAPFLGMVFLAALLGPLLMGGWVWSAGKLVPDFKRLDPLQGIVRLFSLRSAVDLGKSIAKVVLFGTAATLVLRSELDQLLAMGQMSLGSAMSETIAVMLRMVLALTGVMVLIALVDAPWQRREHARKQRMTREEVRREQKEESSSPEVKGRMRAQQVKLSQQKMLTDVPSATVIITNPTHFAVALRYRESDSAPVLVAKGTDELAVRIRAIAVEAEVQVIEAPALARSLHRHTRIGDSIHPDLWVAVAQVLAFVMQVQSARRGELRTYPTPPGERDLVVPDALAVAPDEQTDRN